MTKENMVKKIQISSPQLLIPLNTCILNSQRRDRDREQLDTKRLKVTEQKMIFHTNNNQKRVKDAFQYQIKQILNKNITVKQMTALYIKEISMQQENIKIINI